MIGSEGFSGRLFRFYSILTEWRRTNFRTIIIMGSEDSPAAEKTIQMLDCFCTLSQYSHKLTVVLVSP
jgi:hypothetical protein